VAVAGHTVGDGPHEDVCAAQVRFEGGCVARFLASRVAPDAERSLVVAEAHQTFRLDFAKEPHTEMAVYRPRSATATPRARGATCTSTATWSTRTTRCARSSPTSSPACAARTAPIGTLEDDIRSLTLATDLLDAPTARSPPRCRPRDAAQRATAVDSRHGRRPQQILPHRYPFLMVDAFVSQEGDAFECVKNVSHNEPHFRATSPRSPSCRAC
jgi:hypothetical protein